MVGSTAGGSADGQRDVLSWCGAGLGVIRHGGAGGNRLVGDRGRGVIAFRRGVRVYLLSRQVGHGLVPLAEMFASQGVADGGANAVPDDITRRENPGEDPVKRKNETDQVGGEVERQQDGDEAHHACGAGGGYGRRGGDDAGNKRLTDAQRDPAGLRDKDGRHGRYQALTTGVQRGANGEGAAGDTRANASLQFTLLDRPRQRRDGRGAHEGTPKGAPDIVHVRVRVLQRNCKVEQGEEDERQRGQSAQYGERKGKYLHKLDPKRLHPPRLAHNEAANPERASIKHSLSKLGQGQIK
mmetsp:Transcript_26983/g.75416  ORF Transcript_26983/g.75416 Transcript_26983/m.75416 type:complete len:297 (-) Transcript_26983:362-1252(-)